MSDVFISYSRKDIAFARLLRDSLQQSQVDTWIDWERIPVGEKWWEEICQAIVNANVFMFIISQNSIGSPVCKDEIHQALQNHKRIIPIIVDDLKPEAIREFAPELPRINWIVFDKGHFFRVEEDPECPSEKPEDRQVAFPKSPQFEAALEKLNAAIHTDWEWVKYHTRLQVNALLWEANERKPGYLARGDALEEAEAQFFHAAGKDPQPTTLQAEYVTASRKEETLQQQQKIRLEQKARQRQRAVIWTVGIGLVVAVVLGCLSMVLGGLAWNQRNQAVNESHMRATAQVAAEEQRNIADEQRSLAEQQRDIAVSRQLAAQALYQTDKSPDLALLLSVEAERHGSDAALAGGNVLEVLQSNPRLARFLRGQSGWVNTIAYRPDGKILATGSSNIILWDMSNPDMPRQLEPLLAHTTSVGSVAFSPDGKVLASGSWDGTVRLWDISQPEAAKMIGQALEGHTDWVKSVAFSPDGRIVASASSDFTIRLWDVSRPQAAVQIGQPLAGHRSTVNTVAFSPDGKMLASGSLDNTIILWDLSLPEAPKVIGQPLGLYTEEEVSLENDVTSVAFSPDGKMLASGREDNTIVLWDISQPDAATPIDQSLSDHTNSVECIAFSPDGTRLASGGWGGAILLWDVSRKPIVVGHLLAKTTTSMMAEAIRPDGKVLATGGTDGTIGLWDLSRPGPLAPLGQPLAGHTDFVEGMAFSPDGKILASGSWDKTILLWDVSQPEAPKRIGTPLTGHTDLIHSLAFRSDGLVLASGSQDGTIILWDLSESGASLPIGQPLEGKTGFINTIAFSPDGTILASGSSGDKIVLWDVSLPGRPHLLVKFSGDAFTLTSLAFSPDGQILASGGQDDKISLWDVSQPEAPRQIGQPLDARAGFVNSLAFSPNGRVLASGTSDNLIVLWDVSQPETPRRLGQPLMGFPDSVEGVAFTPDGKRLASVGFEEVIILWDVNVEAWMDHACQVAARNLTQAEWAQYMPDGEPYRKTCPEVP